MNTNEYVRLVEERVKDEVRLEGATEYFIGGLVKEILFDWIEDDIYLGDLPEDTDVVAMVEDIEDFINWDELYSYATVEDGQDEDFERENYNELNGEA